MQNFPTELPFFGRFFLFNRVAKASRNKQTINSLQSNFFLLVFTVNARLFLQEKSVKNFLSIVDKNTVGVVVYLLL